MRLLFQAFRCVRTLMAVSATEEKSTSSFASLIADSEIRKQTLPLDCYLVTLETHQNKLAGDQLVCSFGYHVT